MKYIKYDTLLMIQIKEKIKTAVFHISFHNLIDTYFHKISIK